MTQIEDVVVAQDDERQVLQQLEAALQRQDMVQVVGSGHESLIMPASAISGLRQLIHHLAKGEVVSVVPTHQDLSTQEAANLLHVSRPFFIKLLNEGAMPFIKVGSHRRVRLRDVLIYQQHRDLQRRQGMERLVHMSEDLGLYDEQS